MKEYLEKESVEKELNRVEKLYRDTYMSKVRAEMVSYCCEVVRHLPSAYVVEMRRLTGYDEGLIKDLEWYCRDHRHPKWTRELVKRAAESIAGKNEYRGRWETYKSGEHTECICSACKKSYYYHDKGQYQIDKSRYCPNCGAKMTEV